MSFFRAFLIAFSLLPCATVSHGALLVTYPILSSGGFAVGPVAPGFVASSLARTSITDIGSQGGEITFNAQSSTTIVPSVYLSFSLSNPTEMFQIERLDFNVRSANVNSGFFKLASDVGAVWSTSAQVPVSPIGTLGVSSTTFQSLSLPYNFDAVRSGGKSISFRLYSVSSSGAPFTGVIESFTIHGRVVPEPTSCAVFGLAAFGLLLRRRRR